MYEVYFHETFQTFVQEFYLNSRSGSLYSTLDYCTPLYVHVNTTCIRGLLGEIFLLKFGHTYQPQIQNDTILNVFFIILLPFV